MAAVICYTCPRILNNLEPDLALWWMATHIKELGHHTRCLVEGVPRDQHRRHRPHRPERPGRPTL